MGSKFNSSYNKQVVLLMAHCINDFILNQFNKLKNDLERVRYDVFLIVNTNEPVYYEYELLRANGLSDYIIYFNGKDLLSMGYHPYSSKMIPGSCHFPLFKFYHRFPSYSFYWLIEYDVYFTSNWSCLIDFYFNKPYSFISSHIEKFTLGVNDNWYWWKSFKNSGFDLQHCYKSFNPIYRISNLALEKLDLYLRLQFTAHSELLIATFLINNGFSVADFGGVGRFFPKEQSIKFYIDSPGVNKGSMRYRPIFSTFELSKLYRDSCLFHPIKK